MGKGHWPIADVYASWWRLDAVALRERV